MGSQTLKCLHSGCLSLEETLLPRQTRGSPEVLLELFPLEPHSGLSLIILRIRLKE